MDNIWHNKKQVSDYLSANLKCYVFWNIAEAQGYTELQYSLVINIHVPLGIDLIIWNTWLFSTRGFPTRKLTLGGNGSPLWTLDLFTSSCLYFTRMAFTFCSFAFNTTSWPILIFCSSNKMSLRTLMYEFLSRALR